VTVEPTVNPPPRRFWNRGISWRTARRMRRKERKGRKLTAHDAFVFDELAPGDIAIDCGANVGEIAQLMADRGARVHAFEPDPVAFEMLGKRFAGAANVTCHNVAVSNRAGRMRLYFRREHASDPLVYSVGSSLEAGKSDVDREAFVEVDVVPFADFVVRFPRVRLLKLDIEGAEADVLGDLLEKDLLGRIDLVVVETHEEWVPGLGARLEALREQVAARRLRNIYFNWT
jgi:FkbM family methyltransferase